MKTNTAPTIDFALSELLSALGFAAMAREVRGETDRVRLSRYASVILRQTADMETKRNLRVRFQKMGLA